ncbi:MAG: hypothetical protein SGBAC_005867 [Bacillariaceae sp.]
MIILGVLLLNLSSAFLSCVPTVNAWQMNLTPRRQTSLLLSSRPVDDFLGPQRQESSLVRQSLVDAGTKTNQKDVTEESWAGFSTTSTAVTTASTLEGSSQTEMTPFQQGVRGAICLSTLGYMISPELGDNFIASVYSAISHWNLASTPLFEAKVAVLGFLIPIIGFSSLHLLLGEQTTKASRFDGQLPTRPFEWAEVENWNLAFNPITAYLGSIWIYHQFVHPHAGLPEMAPTLGVFTVEVLFGVCLYDLIFFPIHYFMHHSKWGELRKVHGYHHRINSHSLNALETVQHSYVDGFLQVAVNVLVQQISPFGGFGHKHFLSRLAHNLVVTYLLTEAHSGYDLPWMTHRIFPELLGGSPRHEGHHHDGRVYYQQYFKYLDDFFGFTKDGLEQRKQEQKTFQLQLRQQEEQEQELLSVTSTSDEIEMVQEEEDAITVTAL